MSNRPSDRRETKTFPEPSEDGSLPKSESENVATTPTRSRSIAREIIETLLLAVLIFVAVRAVVLNFRVDGHSMDHSLQNSEMLLVNRNAYFTLDQDTWLGWIPGTSFDAGDSWQPFGTPERGDIVVLNPPADRVTTDTPYIKRVIGIEGDVLEVRDNAVFINGVRLGEPYLDEGKVTSCSNGLQGFCGVPVTIPEGYVYVMGDNRTHSTDSRYFGPIPIEDIIGKAWITFFPIGELGVVAHENYPQLGNAP